MVGRADKIDLAARSGLEITTLLTDAGISAAGAHEMPAAALWARLELEPSALDTTGTGLFRPDWLPDLEAVLGTDMTEQVTAERRRKIRRRRTAPATAKPFRLEHRPQHLRHRRGHADLISVPTAQYHRAEDDL